MHGVFIESGPSDWQIIQHENGTANIRLSGTFQVPSAAIEVGTESACPVVRVLSEDDNSQILPWTKTNLHPGEDGMSGAWDTTLTLPAGGLYRIETGLDTKSTKPELTWVFRGDVRLHIGVGDLFIIAGQSNSSGYGRDSALDPPDLHVHLYRNRDSWDLACHPMNESSFAADKPNAEMGISGTSPYLSFGKALHKISGYPVGFIMTAQGGSPISRWDTRQNGDLFHNMITQIRKCTEKAAGILWYQGCADTTPTNSVKYLDCFRHFVTETRKELGYTISFFTFQLNRQMNADYSEEWGIIREAQRQAARMLSSVYILPTLHCGLCDGIHNNSHSAMMLGENMAKLCGGILYHTPGFFAPDISDAVYADHVIRLMFDHMRRGFLVVNNNPCQCCFYVRDSAGTIPIISLGAVKDNPCLDLTLEREPDTSLQISYCRDADPSHIALFDEVTFMPPLSFYDFPVKRV